MGEGGGGERERVHLGRGRTGEVVYTREGRGVKIRNNFQIKHFLEDPFLYP